MTDLAHRLTIPLLALIYTAVFEYSIAGMRFESRALPQILIIILAAVGVYTLWQEVSEWRRARAEPETAAETEVPTGGPIRVGMVMAATALYVLALEPVGFYIATAGFVAVVFSAFEGVSWRVVPFAAGVVGAFYVLFEHILTVQLPGSF